MKLISAGLFRATLGASFIHRAPYGSSVCHSLSSLSVSVETPNHIETETKRWIEDHVIKLNLCPFAKGALLKGSLQVIASQATDVKSLRNEVVDAAINLHNTALKVGSGTTVIAAPNVKLIEDFHEYLYLVEEISNDMNWSGLFGKIQIASFHPNYQFEGTEGDDITNYSNRSPWPLFHLLREVEVSAAVDRYNGDTDIIWQNNQKTITGEGRGKLDAFLCSFSKQSSSSDSNK